MAYVISGVCIVLCVIIIIFCLGVLKENRKLRQRIAEEDEDEFLSRRKKL